MLNQVLRVTLASAVCATAVALSSRADAHVSCNLRIPCPLTSIHHGRVASRASDRYYYKS